MILGEARYNIILKNNENKNSGIAIDMQVIHD